MTFKNIEGLPNTTIIVPVAKETAGAYYEAMGNALGKVDTYNLGDLKDLPKP